MDSEGWILCPQTAWNAIDIYPLPNGSSPHTVAAQSTLFIYAQLGLLLIYLSIMLVPILLVKEFWYLIQYMCDLLYCFADY
jgi:hypothetical protein